MNFPGAEGLTLLQFLHLYHGLNAVMAYVMVEARRREFE